MEKNISHVLSTISRDAGGPSVSVRRLVESLKKTSRDANWHVLAGDAARSGDAENSWTGVRPQLFATRGPRRIGWAPGLPSALANLAPTLIHLHGLWQYHAWASHRVAQQTHVPLVISPRGMLEPWALRQGRTQKWIAGVLFQRRMLEQAACIVATSRLEAEGLRSAGVTSPVAIIPNGVDVPPEHWRALGEASRGAGVRRTALFLSRVHPKKGILDLLSAWKVLAPRDWRLRIVGPSEGGHAGVVAAYIHAHGLRESVTLEGPLWGDDKRQALAEAALFILPSYSENFGLVIAEALAAAVPVITTKATPWQELVTERCGWWSEVGAAALTEVLNGALNTPAADLAAMGRRGRALMERRYSWRTVAEDMMELYRWVLGETKDAPVRLMFPSAEPGQAKLCD